MPLSIILAEDEELIATAYKMGLEFAGHTVRLACDGNEALKHIQQEKPDILLLDLIMPGMNGFETLEALRANPDTASLPVLVVSNLGQPADESRARELGANDFIIKSNYSIGELLERIDALLAHAH